MDEKMRAHLKKTEPGLLRALKKLESEKAASRWFFDDVIKPILLRICDSS